MANILIINGSYRKEGISSQIINLIEDELETVEIINLIDKNIYYCLNCRGCTQNIGENPGECVINDGMQDIINKIELADKYILISPTNFYTVTAVYKAFLERLTVYGYWPWGEVAPKYRKKDLNKKAIVISSCAAPSFFGKYIFGTIRLLKLTAKTIGAKVVGSLMIGLISQKTVEISKSDIAKIKKILSVLADK